MATDPNIILSAGQINDPARLAQSRMLQFEEMQAQQAMRGQNALKQVFTILAFTTGARMGAILDLTWDRVDLKARTIDFNPGGRDQTNKRRTVVPINERAFAALVEAREGALTDYVVEYGGKQVKSVKKAIAAASRRAKVPCSPHDFRRSAARWMAEADVSMERIAQFLGHTSTRVTYATYARFSPRFMADAAKALDW